MPTAYRNVRADIHDGDLFVYRGTGLLSRIYSGTHAELARWKYDPYGRPTVLETTGFREFQGARTVTLSSQVNKYPGQIDVYRPRCEAEIAYVASDLLARQGGKRYSLWTIIVAFLWHFMLFRFLFQWGADGTDAAPPSKWSAAKVCSSSIVWAYRRAFGKDRTDEGPCPGVPEWRCFPQRLAEDSFFVLTFQGLIDTRLV